jgi:hypothetical protein
LKEQMRVDRQRRILELANSNVIEHRSEAA